MVTLALLEVIVGIFQRNHPIAKTKVVLIQKILRAAPLEQTRLGRVRCQQLFRKQKQIVLLAEATLFKQNFVFRSSRSVLICGKKLRQMRGSSSEMNVK